MSYFENCINDIINRLRIACEEIQLYSILLKQEKINLSQKMQVKRIVRELEESIELLKNMSRADPVRLLGRVEK